MGEILGYIAQGTSWTVILTFGSAAIGIVLAAPLMVLAQSRFAALRGIYTGSSMSSAVCRRSSGCSSPSSAWVSSAPRSIP